ncbi:MAG: type II toxin-antitoxin system VapC family toxin [Candidatus Bathyarchaeia archaeon]|jgi:predicted nucleic acid-binding protein
MPKLFLDANLVIYLNTVTGEERPIIDRFFKSLLRERLFTNMLVLDETLHVSRRRYAVPYIMTIDFLRRAFLPYTEIIPIAEEDLQATERYLTEYDVKPSDAIHLATMDKVGITSIVSEDEELDAVKGIKRVWLDTTGQGIRGA